MNMVFGGAKIALLLGNKVLAYRRDDKVEIPFPNFWDLPGGGREGQEAPFECIQRETLEEFGFVCLEDRVLWQRAYVSPGSGIINHFFVGQLSHKQVRSVRFGDEGQEWRLMRIDEFLTRPDAIPQLQERLQDYLRTRPKPRPSHESSDCG